MDCKEAAPYRVKFVDGLAFFLGIVYNKDIEGNDGVADCYEYSGVKTTSELGLSQCEFTFGLVPGVNNYTRTISVFVHQFERIFEFRCVFNVEKPILSERVVINSPIYEDKNGYYINLKKDGEYRINEPGTVKQENWAIRFDKSDFNAKTKKYLLNLTKKYNR